MPLRDLSNRPEAFCFNFKAVAPWYLLAQIKLRVHCYPIETVRVNCNTRAVTLDEESGMSRQTEQIAQNWMRAAAFQKAHGGIGLPRNDPCRKDNHSGMAFLDQIGCLLREWHQGGRHAILGARIMQGRSMAMGMTGIDTGPAKTGRSGSLMALCQTWATSLPAKQDRVGQPSKDRAPTASCLVPAERGHGTGLEMPLCLPAGETFSADNETI